MSNDPADLREALAGLAEKWDEHGGPYPDEAVIVAAARQHLPLLPEPCGTCGGSGNDEQSAAKDLIDAFGHLAFKKGETMVFTCPSCHGRGYLYKPETVQIVADLELTVQERTGRHLNGGWHYLTESEIYDLLDALVIPDEKGEK